MRVVLVIAGIDPSGGAGLIADVATIAARGHHPAALPTALTVQDSARCHAAQPLDATWLERSLAVLLADVQPAAIKIGMVGSAEIAQAIVRALDGVTAPIVFDPVLRASVGVSLLEGDAQRALAALVARATLVTPNRHELAALGGVTVTDRASQQRAAEALLARGARAVLAKGGHLEGAEVSDVLVQRGADARWLASPRVEGETPHGTGCALATEIARALAEGHELVDAVAIGRARFMERIARAVQVGGGRPFLGPAIRPSASSLSSGNKY